MGWDVTVYGRRGATKPDDPTLDVRIKRRITWGMETQKLSTLSHGLTAALDAAVRKPDVALIMNCANGYFLPILRARGIPTLVNVDGIEWERDKWSPTAKRVFRKAAECTAKWADGLVFDARRIAQYWKETFDAEGTFIPYGGDIAAELPLPRGLRRREYVLVVTRFVPENTVSQFFEAVPVIAEKYPVVIVGSSGYGGELDDTARRLSAHPSVTWLGHVHDDQLLLALWQHAGLYFHGHSVGGTNPALVQAMAAGAPILARDTDYNREVLGSAGEFVSEDPELIAKTVLHLMDNREAREQESHAGMRRAAQHYSWSSVARSYDGAMRAVMEARGVAAQADVLPIPNRVAPLNVPVRSPMRPQRLAM
ncbi:glycosyl transferase [Mycobacterium sp. CBMA 234]|nr:glycosyl transferase [Mycolicibacterium sp. CBMA 234]